MTLNPYEPPAGGTPSDATGANSPLAGWESIVKRLLVWCVGFVLLFAINAFVELLVLPRWGLDKSAENDIYFKCWWLMVGLWFVFGNALLAAFERSLKSRNHVDK